ncbi:MAG: DUF1566 domain-containing protein [Spirochaetia bacterium]|nr:DUF1566 domain-containing protein [Spirochaetia bacterium]
MDAIVDYWWQSSETIDGTYTDIEMGNEETYTLQATDVDKFIRVEAEAAASQLAYTGSVFSVSIGPVLSAPLESIGAITGHPRVESTLEIGNFTPLDATVDIQWQISDTKNGTYDAIPDAEGTNYVVKDTDKLKYIRIQATGNGGYQGVLTSESVQIGYEVGDIGPLGGTIIMDKGVYDKSVGFCTTGYNFRSDTTVTEAWRYLELAPKGWFSSGSDPTTKWDTTPIDSASRPSYGLTEVGNTLALVGEGKESTDAILEELGAQAAAATQVRSYGTQWYLPTVSELKLVYSALTADERVAAGLATSGYTTSSEISYTQTWLVDMGDGGQFYTGWHKWDEFYVRPMRRF